jgi:hypothetical protein
MARSARELFEAAMKLDPKERATLMRLLIDTLDAKSEEGAEEAWRAEIEHGCTSAEWRRRRSGFHPAAVQAAESRL